MFWIWCLQLSFFTHSLPLNEAVSRAYKNHLDSLEAELNVKVADQTIEQVKREAYPTLTLSSNTTWRGLDGTDILDTHRHLAPLNLNQPLYSGGALSAGIAAAKAGRLSRGQQLELAKRNVYAELGDVYFRILQLQSEIKNLVAERGILVKRVGTLEQRSKIGRSKLSEVLSAQSGLARVEAELARLESDLGTQQERLYYLVGVRDTKVKYETISLAQKPDFKTHPSIQSIDASIESLEQQMIIEKASVRPSVELDFNYYLDNTNIFSFNAHDWDLGLSMTWELYSGDRLDAELVLQELEIDRLKLQRNDRLRWLESQWTTQSQLMNKQQLTMSRLKRALQLAKSNYQETVREAEQGLVANLALLTALDDFQAIKRSHDAQKYRIEMTKIQLNALAGEIP